MKVRYVDFVNNKQDLQALVLGKMGFSTAYIVQKTGLTMGQVLYRLHKQAVNRLAYRNGQSDEASWVLGQVESRLRRQIRDQVAHNGTRILPAE